MNKKKCASITGAFLFFDFPMMHLAYLKYKMTVL